MQIDPTNPLSAIPYPITTIHGYTAVSQIVNMVVYDDNENYVLITWEYKNMPGYTDNDITTYVYINGEFTEKCSSPQYKFSFDSVDSEIVNLEFLPTLAYDGMESYLYISGYEYLSKVKLSWTNTGYCDQLHIQQSDDDGNSWTTIKEYTKPIIQQTVNAASISGFDAYFDGTWTGDKKYAQITISITTGGIAGVAKWQCIFDGETITGTTSQYRGNLFRGLKGYWEEDVTFVVNDTWNVYLEMPEEYTTIDLTDGDYDYRLAAINTLNIASYSTTLSFTIDNYPDAPVYQDYEFGYGNPYSYFDITWLAPSNTDIHSIRYYRNLPDIQGYMIKDVDPIPVGYVYNPTPYEPITVRFNAVNVEGEHRFLARTVDNKYQEEKNNDQVIFNVTQDVNAHLFKVIDIPSKPISIQAELNTRNAEITITVIVDDICDSVNIYGDATTGTVDYSTVLATISNTGTSTYNTITTDIVLADGDYILAARSSLNGIEEDNTDILTYIQVNTSPANVPTGFTGEIVQ